MRSNFRFILPISIGSLSAVLMLWDTYNQHVIQSMGEAWDTGASLWPYQTPEILFSALNTPSFVLGRPLANILQLTRPSDYLTIFTASLLWWFCAGLFIDRQRPKQHSRKLRIRFGALCLLSLLLAMGGLEASVSAFRWWFTYSREFFTWNNLIMIRTLAPAAWCFLLCALAALAAKRIAKGWKSQSLAIPLD
jgi:hypothetical protein